MVYRGHVANGVIQLEGSVVLPEGVEVRVEIVHQTPPDAAAAGGVSLYERLKPVIGAVTSSPSDGSVNVDHYLYGHPKH